MEIRKLFIELRELEGKEPQTTLVSHKKSPVKLTQHASLGNQFLCNSYTPSNSHFIMLYLQLTRAGSDVVLSPDPLFWC